MILLVRHSDRNRFGLCRWFIIRFSRFGGFVFWWGLVRVFISRGWRLWRWHLRRRSGFSPCLRLVCCIGCWIWNFRWIGLVTGWQRRDFSVSDGCRSLLCRCRLLGYGLLMESRNVGLAEELLIYHNLKHLQTLLCFQFLFIDWSFKTHSCFEIHIWNRDFI